MVLQPAGGVSNLTRIPPLKSLIKVGLGCVVFAAASSLLNARSNAEHGPSVIWLSNGFLVGVLLCSPRRQWPTFLALGAAIDFAVNVGLDNPLGVSLYFTACNLIEIVLASSLMYRTIAPCPDLTEPPQLRSFLFYGVFIAPLIASLLSVIGLHQWLGTPFLASLQVWLAADILGVALITPLYLSFHHRRQFSLQSDAETALLFLLLTAVSLFVFDYATAPLIWIVLLFLILLGARVGFTGSAAGLLLVTFIGGFSTVTGYGPLAANIQGALATQILLFQIFIGTTMVALYVTEVAMATSTRMRLGLEASETRFRLLAEASRDVIVLAGLDGERKYVSPAATELLGWTQQEMLAEDSPTITHPDDAPALANLLADCRDGKDTRTLSYRCRKKDGTYLWLESSIRLFRDTITSEPAGFVFILRDISERKLAEEKLQDAFHTVEQLAMVDGLTGIANRRLMDETLSREWMRALRDNTQISLILIDVDYFKLFNDLYGHLAGDACLQTIAGAIQETLRRPPDLLARYGGEEFVIILPNTPPAGAEVLSRKVMQIVEACAIPHTGSPYGQITVSLGCATLQPTMQTSTKHLLKAADDAMYRAKTGGRNRMQLWSDALIVN